MTTASSTSQSTLRLWRGMTSGSFGPTTDEDALKKITGSFGSSMPLSAAWSRKLRPMQTILLGRHTGGPSRVSGGTRGARDASRSDQPRSRGKPSLPKKFSS